MTPTTSPIRASSARLLVAMSLLFLLIGAAACTPPSLTPTPVAAGPSPTFTPTMAADPSEVTAEIASAAPTASPTPIPTSTDTPTATPSPTSTPTSTPTPAAALELARAERLLHNGDLDRAIAAYTEILQKYPTDPLIGDVKFGLGRAQWFNSDPAATAAVFEELAKMSDYVSAHPEVNYWLGRALARLGEGENAAAAFLAFAEAEPRLASLAYQKAGDAYAAVGDTTNAIDNYENALAVAGSVAEKMRAREGIAAASLQADDLERAIAQYEAILIIAQNAGYRAETLYRLAQTQMAAGRPDEAFASLQQALTAAPKSPFAYQALVDLVNAEQPVDPLLRARIDIAAGAYHPALSVLQDYIASDPNYDPEAHVLAAQAYEGIGDYLHSEIEWQQLTDLHPDDVLTGEAWLGRGRSYWRRDDAATARQVYLRGAEMSADRAAAAEALWWAAVIAERDEATIADAAAEFARLAQEYPESKYATRAAFRAGLTTMQLGDLANARAAWEPLAARQDGLWSAAADFWLGRLLEAEGKTDEAIAHWQGMTERWGPGNYYGLRVRQILAERSQTEFDPGEAGDPGSDSLPALVAWLRSWVEAEIPDDLLAPNEDLAQAAALDRIGETSAAASAFEALRRRWNDDPVALTQLALLTRDLGYYNTSIRAAARVVALSPAGVSAAPLYLQKLVYPIYYEDLILPAALKYGMDPYVLLGLIRQESLFGSAATSGAAARGLAQIIPSTGRSIAQQLGWTNYSDELLYRPFVNVDFGAYYLSQGLKRTDGNVPEALAGYNGGPGNAAFWRRQAGDDDDLFLELISFDETQLYLRTIAVQSNHYRRIYPQLAREFVHVGE